MCLVGKVLPGDTNRNGMARRFSHLVSLEEFHDRYPKHFSIDLHKWHHHVRDCIERPMG